MTSTVVTPFLHKGISRLKAEQLLLEAKEDGSFLVRDSESVTGAYTLCILYQGRVYQYRILTDDSKKLTIQTRDSDGQEKRRYCDLAQLVHEYKQRGESNSLVCALGRSIEAKKEEHEPDSEDEEMLSEGRECAPTDDVVSQQLQKKFSHLDMSCFDGEFVNELQTYVQYGLAKDVEKLGSQPAHLTHLRKLLTHAAKDFNKEMLMFLRKVELCRQLFSIASANPAATKFIHEKEDAPLDMETFLERLGQCKEIVETVEEKAIQAAKSFSSSTASSTGDKDDVFDDNKPLRPFTSRYTSKRKAIIAPSSFEVKLMGNYGKASTINLTVDVHAGKLYAVRPNKDVLDDSNTFHVDKVLQLIKNTANNCRLEVLVEGRKKDCYQFTDVREREHFCQLVQRMKNIHSVSEETDLISVFVGSFNMGDSSFPVDTSEWFRCQGSGKTVAKNLSYDPHDLCAIGTQESSGSERDWANKVKAALFEAVGVEYHVVTMCSLWAMRLIILVRPEHKNKISHVQQSTVKTGIANALGNKGGVGISLYFSGTTFCFVNCHLTSGSEKNTRRNNNYHSILSSLSSSIGRKPLSSFADLMGQFHHIFWFGDLNYRVEAECQDILKKVTDKQYEPLLQVDQLAKSIAAQEAFLGFQEEKIMFPPSYRYTRGSDTYDWRKVKKTCIRINVPSWCDRVLWCSFPHTYIANTSYGTADSIKTSDHRPLFATFDIGIMTQSQGMVSPLKNDVKIIFDRVEAEIKTTSKLKFRLEFHSSCLESPVQSKVNKAFTNKTLRTDAYICPEWTADMIDNMAPIAMHPDYIEEQHLLIAVKAIDSDESYGECVLALKSRTSIAAQPFSCCLMHNGELTGKLRGMMHVSSEVGSKGLKRKRKSYELITMDTNPHCYANVSIYDDVAVMVRPSEDGASLRLPKVNQKTKSMQVPMSYAGVPPVPPRSTSFAGDLRRPVPHLPVSSDEAHNTTAPADHAVSGEIYSEAISEDHYIYSEVAGNEMEIGMGEDSEYQDCVAWVDTQAMGDLESAPCDEPNLTSPTQGHNPPRRPRMGQSALKAAPASQASLMTHFPGPSMESQSSSLILEASEGNLGAMTEREHYSAHPPPIPEKTKPSVPIPAIPEEDVYDSLKKPSSVNEWLLDIGLPCYIRAFLDNGWDSFQFVGEITEDDLEEIGVGLSEHRERIITSLCQLGMK